MCTRRMDRADRREQPRAWSSHHSRRSRSNDEPTREDFRPSAAEPATERDPRHRVEEVVLIAIILVAIVALVLT
jgi:hypothetical protein